MSRTLQSVVSIPRRRSTLGAGGFTLIELLVVIGLIGILAGTLGLALGGRGGDGRALASAQQLVASLVGVTRAQAILHQTNARLIVHAQPPPGGAAGRYLRQLQVVREEPFESGSYVASGDPVALPDPICVVPSYTVPADHLSPGVVWPTGSVSTLTVLNAFRYSGQAGNGAPDQFFGAAGASGRILFLQFGSDGLVSDPAIGAKVALATAVLSASEAPTFNNRFGVRGVLLRRSGSATLVNDPEGF